MTLKKLTLPAIACAFIASAGAATACATPENVNGLAGQLVQGINAARTGSGSAAIAVDNRLMAAAQEQACHLARTGTIDHRGPRGGMAVDRVTRAGYSSCLTAENLAWGFSDPDRIVTGWMQSPAHRSNMLHQRVSDFGIGIAQGAQGPVWVLVLARDC